jgi:hypothetical protein
METRAGVRVVLLVTRQNLTVLPENVRVNFNQFDDDAIDAVAMPKNSLPASCEAMMFRK